jgi:hypothetical protein
VSNRRVPGPSNPEFRDEPKNLTAKSAKSAKKFNSQDSIPHLLPESTLSFWARFPASAKPIRETKGHLASWP